MIGTRPAGAFNARIRRIASTPSMPGSTMSISTASNCPCSMRAGAASPRPTNSV